MVKKVLVRRALLASAALTLAACGSSRPAYSPENAPPALAWVTEPPQYTVSQSLTVNVTATSNLGVKAVYARAGTTRTPAVKQGDGTWLVEITLPVVGHNIIAVWAEDFTSPTPNSGENGDAPYRLVADVNYAPTPPSISYDATFGSYTDERSIQLVVDANGIAKVPAEYTIGPKLPIPPGGDIYKASTRLSGGAMTAAELESTNRNNIPVLRFTVPHNPNIDPPLETPSYIAHVTCSGCPEFADMTGSLLLAAATDPQRALFDLPVSTETVPALAQILGAATVSFTITVKSSAGAQTTVPGFNFVVHVIGAPIAVAEDTQYASAMKPDSTFAYRLSDNTYATLWSVSAFASSGVRLARYIVTNPESEPVALQLTYSQASGGSWQAYETWESFGIAEKVFHGDTSLSKRHCYDTISYTQDGFRFTTPTCVAVGAGLPCFNVTTNAQSTGNVVFHLRGDVVHQYVCGMTVLTGDSGVFSTSNVAFQLQRVAPELAGQERDPETDTSRQWVLVPPAAGGQPGALVVYVVRPASASRTRDLAWNLLPYSDFDAYNHYQTWDRNMWLRMSSPDSGYDWFQNYRSGRYLASAEDRLYGSIAGQTRPYADGAVLGESAVRVDHAILKEPLFTH